MTSGTLTSASTRVGHLGKSNPEKRARERRLRRFEILRESANGAVLIREKPAQLLLGRRTPLVGRDKELALAAALWREAIDDSVARALVVTAPPGGGKTRLAEELLERFGDEPDLQVLVARMDSVAPGGSLRIARELVRAEGGSAELPAHLEALAIEAADRADPAGMRPRMERVFAQWLERLLARGPVALVVDDVQWGDAPSLAMIEAAARHLADRPLMLMAFGRPETEQLFPGHLGKSNPEKRTRHLGKSST